MQLIRSVFIALSLAACVAGCAHNRPPVKVLEAIHQVDHYAPLYVDQANKALDQTANPDAERLKGIGDRLVQALDALDRWAWSLAEKQTEQQQKEPGK
jgi:hypothetical protein